MQNPIRALIHQEGLYIGHGVNHEGQKFEGTLEIKKLLSDLGIQLKFTATSWDKPEIVFHDEVSVIAPNARGGFSLFNLNTNTAFMSEHEFVPMAVDSSQAFVFRFGDIADSKSFREEVKLEIVDTDIIGYHYSWGMPDGEFAYRSGLDMVKTDTIVARPALHANATT